ncbi:MAG: hypothetical protein GX817_01490, partial [Elusimicrobia bacterium]|nr:hypothetical protein [Elusimicrobiota bacterium]
EYLEVSFKNKDLLTEKTVVTAPHLKSVTEFSSYKINTGLTVENFDFAPSGRVNIIEID